MRARLFVAGLIVAGLVSGCTGDNPSTPITPSSPTLISVTLSGNLAILSGQTTQLTATANFAKGTTQDVTSQAAWSSATPTIATVSAGGLVTAVSSGIAEIHATYQSVTGSLQVTINTPPAYTLSGKVTESAPHTSRALAGVRVEILDGTNQGKFALSDASGQYQITNVLAASFNVRAHLDTYDDVTKAVTLSTNVSLPLTLNPTPRSITETFTGTISGGDPAGTCGSPCKIFSVPIHNTGSLQATLTWTSSEDARLLIQLYNTDTNRLLAQSPITPSDTSTSTRESVSSSITSSGNYELRVLAWQIARITAFTVTTTHVN